MVQPLTGPGVGAACCPRGPPSPGTRPRAAACGGQAAAPHLQPAEAAAPSRPRDAVVSAARACSAAGLKGSCKPGPAEAGGLGHTDSPSRPSQLTSRVASRLPELTLPAPPPFVDIKVIYQTLGHLSAQATKLCRAESRRRKAGKMQAANNRHGGKNERTLEKGKKVEALKKAFLFPEKGAETSFDQGVAHTAEKARVHLASRF
ncbi:uncharacterized protein [Canis lupus baileyi]|uniref:uncharacterized protein n=1 Tax=Canis lupus baileyi TaxID=143281 RepID=UPI003B977CF2